MGQKLRAQLTGAGVARRRGIRHVVPLAATLLFFGGGTALAQTQQRSLNQFLSPFERAQQAFDALPEKRRKEIQDGLVWSGNYSGGIDGEFGPMTMRAIQAYERRGKGARDGILSLRDINALTRAAIKRKAALKFSLVVEPRAGLRIGLPMKLLRRRNSADGAIFESRDKTLRVRTFTIPESRQSLADLYEDLRAPVRGRRVAYKVLRNDFLVVSTQSRSRFNYVRAARVPAAVGADPQRGQAVLRGYSLSVAQSLMRKRGQQFKMLTIAISNSFDPAPSSAKAGSTTAGAADPAAASSATAGSGDTIATKSEYLAATALAVAPDTYLTILPPSGCRAARIGKAPAQLKASDKPTGLALFKAPVGGGAPANVTYVEQLSPGPAFGLFAELPFPGANAHISVARGELGRSNNSGSQPMRANIAMPNSAAGGLVVAGSGDLAGFVAPGGIGGKKLAGSVPSASRSLIGPAKIKEFLAKAGVPGSPVSARSGAAPAPKIDPNGTLGAASIAAKYARALTAVWCQR